MAGLGKKTVRFVFFGLCSFGVVAGLSAAPHGIEVATAISIRAESAEGEKWIRSETELVRAYPVDIDELKSVIEDFASYPGILPHLVKTTILERDEVSTTIRQRYEISILGYTYPTEYDLRLEEAGSAAKRWTLSWSLAGSDGSVGESSGSWTLEPRVDEAGRAGTIVTHRNVAVVRKKFPLQVAVMRAFARRELDRVPDSVFVEALRRTRTLARSGDGARE